MTTKDEKKVIKVESEHEAPQKKADHVTEVTAVKQPENVPQKVSEVKAQEHVEQKSSEVKEHVAEIVEEKPHIAEITEEKHVEGGIVEEHVEAKPAGKLLFGKLAKSINERVERVKLDMTICDNEQAVKELKSFK